VGVDRRSGLAHDGEGLVREQIWPDPGESRVKPRRKLDWFLERRIFAPLGMSTTSFLPPATERGTLAKIYT
jgi:hypothetical protein